MTDAEKALKWVTDHTDYISPTHFNVICDALQRAAECEKVRDALTLVNGWIDNLQPQTMPYAKNISVEIKKALKSYQEGRE